MPDASVKPWIRLAFLALGAAVLILLIAGTNVDELRAAIGRAESGLVGTALLLIALDVWLKGVRWRFMAAQLAQPPLSLWQAAIAVLAGVAAGSLVPARGMELAKPLLLRRSRGVPLAASTAAVIVERLLDGTGFIVVFGVSVALLPSGRAAEFRPALAAIGLLVVAVGLVVVIPTRISGALSRIMAALPLPDPLHVHAVRIADAFFSSMLIWRRREQLWLALALSVVAALVEAVRVTVVFAALQSPITVVQAMFAFSLANLVAALTFVPGGIGITELSMAGIVRLIVSSGGAAVTAAVLVDRFLSYYLVVVAGSLVLLGSGSVRPGGRGNAGAE